MNTYAIKHCHWNGLDYYTPQIWVTETRYRYWLFPYKYGYWQPMRGPNGYNGTLENAKAIIEQHKKETALRKEDYEEYLPYNS